MLQQISGSLTQRACEQLFTVFPYQPFREVLSYVPLELHPGRLGHFSTLFDISSSFLSTLNQDAKYGPSRPDARRFKRLQIWTKLLLFSQTLFQFTTWKYIYLENSERSPLQKNYFTRVFVSIFISNSHRLQITNPV